MQNMNTNPSMNIQMNQQQQPVTLNINQNVNIQQDGYALNSGAPADQPFNSDQMGAPIPDKV